MPQLLEFKYTTYLEHTTKQYKKVVFVNLMPEDNELKKYIKIGSRPRGIFFSIRYKYRLYVLLS